MNSTNQILVKNIVSNTESNVEGVKLYCVINRLFKDNIDILLEVDNDMILSSSFLNSSLGNILDDFGIDKLKRSLKIKCNKTQFERISSYLYKYNELYQK